MNKYKLALGAVALVLGFSGCAKNTSGPTAYADADVGVVKKVQKGVVLSERVVRIYNNPANAGEVKPGSNPNEGAVEGLDYAQGSEYVIRLEDGQIVSLVQSEGPRLPVSQRVLVIYGKTTRVVANQV